MRAELYRKFDDSACEDFVSQSFGSSMDMDDKYRLSNTINLLRYEGYVVL